MDESTIYDLEFYFLEVSDRVPILDITPHTRAFFDIRARNPYIAPHNRAFLTSRNAACTHETGTWHLFHTFHPLWKGEFNNLALVEELGGEIIEVRGCDEGLRSLVHILRERGTPGGIEFGHHIVK